MLHNYKEDKKEYKPEFDILCCTKYKDRSDFKNILQYLDLPEVHKEIIQARYINIIESCQRKVHRYSVLYFIGHFIITVGSLFVPALLSIQNSDKTYLQNNSNITVNIYWATFVVSLLVTIFNGILTLFKVDKKYYFLHTILERLRSEGWQYVGLTGRYSGSVSNIATHRNQFIYFVHHIEKLKMKQVEEEYYKTDEKIAQNPHNSNQSTVTHDLYPPSPNKPIDSITNNTSVPEPVQETIDSYINKSKSVIIPTKLENITIIPNKPDENINDESKLDDNKNNNILELSNNKKLDINTLELPNTTIKLDINDSKKSNIMFDSISNKIITDVLIKHNMK